MVGGHLENSGGDCIASATETPPACTAGMAAPGPTNGAPQVGSKLPVSSGSLSRHPVCWPVRLVGVVRIPAVADLRVGVHPAPPGHPSRAHQGEPPENTENLEPDDAYFLPARRWAPTAASGLESSAAKALPPARRDVREGGAWILSPGFTSAGSGFGQAVEVWGCCAPARLNVESAIASGPPCRH